MGFEHANAIIHKWRAESQERKRWAEQNPELAKTWDMAIQEDEARTQAAKIRRHELEQELELPHHLLRCGAPERAVQALCGQTRETLARSAVQRFLKSDKAFLLLSGAAGVGKTVAAIEVLKTSKRRTTTQDLDQVLEWDAWRGLFIRASQLARLSKYAEEHQAIFEKACTAKALVLDDLGAEQLTESWREALDELIDRRYDGSRKKTVITTNLSIRRSEKASPGEEKLSPFAQRYGERIIGRLEHDGVAVSCGFESLRKNEVRFEIRKADAA